ncbi:OmpA family protein [Pseudomonas sp. MAP12]|uniref:OmpA family protein n=1 Tax=Geopseudomonas aromaticivorans TaxID=2849492 RepID=A0ABS6N209_9GAMM|nr:OmpA family protein [Pseudomonas aromaticivorans]MBV2134636.1 OmpA family protein [Pseudomonas aromaticivorans]
MGNIFAKAALPLLLVSGVLAGCASTTSTGDAPLNQKNWPWCSLLGGLVGGGLGATESSAWAGGGAAAGAILGGLLCYAQDGDEDKDGVFDRRDRCQGTPANTPVGHNGCPLPQYPEKAAPPAPQDEVIVLSDLGEVLFAFDSAKLTPAAMATLDTVVEKLKGSDVVGIKVNGHTDSTGTDAYNQGLSERRAASVVDYLVSQGVAPDKLTSEGFGESKPVADNASKEGRAENRRVEIMVDR